MFNMASLWPFLGGVVLTLLVEFFVYKYMTRGGAKYKLVSDTSNTAKKKTTRKRK